MISRQDVIRRRDAFGVYSIIEKGTARKLGTIQRDASWTGRDVAWDIFIDGEAHGYNSEQRDAIRQILNHHNRAALTPQGETDETV